ncbi:MAG: hypothetical protein HKN21_06195, partial [Candidatus Eisenbacteria bacterium]|nr:hypothetical protein [Candidatus Eisenbacteria bacterium]
LPWLIGLGFALIVASLVVPFEWRRITSDAWFHVAVVHEMSRAGIPPQDPYFAGLGLQYFWFFHTVLLGWQHASSLSPAGTMALLNIVGAGLCVPAAATLGRALNFPKDACRWAGVVILLGMGGMFWALFPIKLITLFYGEVTGMAAVRDLVGDTSNLMPIDTGRIVSIGNSTSFILRKFLVGTAASWAMLLVLITGASALRFARHRRAAELIFLFLSSLGAFLFHTIVGGASVVAIAGGAFLVFVTGRGPRKPSLWIMFAIALSLVLCVPYLMSVTSGKESSNMFPLGIHLWAILSLPITLFGVGLLAPFALKRIWKRGPGPDMLFLGWLLCALGYALLARLPGPNQFDKPPMILYMPLAVAAGLAIPAIWHKLTRTRSRVWFAVALFMFLVPENCFRAYGFFNDRFFPANWEEEAPLYEWIGENTERDAVVIDAPERTDVLLRAPRRQLYGLETYAYQWGYDAEEMDRRYKLKQEIYKGSGALPKTTVETLRSLSIDLDAPLYVVVRNAETPNVSRRLLASRQFQSVFHEDGRHVFSFQP